MKKKSTNWQLKFFIAIMTSWTAFNIFYCKQFNKKMFDQYLKRFFRSIGSKDLSKDRVKYISEVNKINRLVIFLEKTKVDSPRSSFENEIPFEKSNLLLAISNINSNRTLFCDSPSCNHIMTIKFKNLSGRVINLNCVYNAGEVIKELYNYINIYHSNEDYVIFDKILLDDSRIGYILVHDVLIAILRNYVSIVENNYRHSKKANMNIGLEFEYDIKDNETIPVKKLLELDSQYITEISTGYDCADYTSDRLVKSKFTKIFKAETKSHTRLNEDRIRINHFKGLEILEKYLIYLNTYGKISKSSSVHVHIDCKYDNSFEKLLHYSKDSSLHKYLKRTKYPSLLDIIYLSRSEKSFTKKGYLSQGESGIIDLIKGSMLKNDLETLEFRSFKTSFLYEDIVMYILIASYITNSIKKGTKINDNLIKTIIKANNIVKTNKK